ncbi:magnesium and cobalt transport protein CorA [Fischerella thermalis CCMEE 5273]|uniref:Magnesium transport protein CorA n=1 Tax=Fischerella thermalis JSC-11 TaxID=741277 RepID=G6FVY2_9CYAN|nr:magnesium/cobalt transporter CorA [Fischerella thermalis]PMB03320.1 magnesium and cobalt transport protein CorA [Fischerella thermalis CCMEE 5273]PMB11677.1 magnesium and cobalt transport protein CorA [Fischerella thermalis CCMEE 5328]EHC11621.1 magnesium and cobalt transport protein CorA [Fischerella thermalis JSC-11]PLZ10284.1 magnesium and cobalt transport protein CorA [Fischerella thermalis WC114]PLZ12250.1 magnesium and cobalt transport protein CorA [Fischerella thermalis WC119]
MAKKKHHLNSIVTEPESEDFYHQPGTIPGTIIVDANAPPPKIILIDYSPTEAISKEVETPEDCIPYLDTESVSWVDVRGLGSEDILQRLGQVFELHPLVLEDIVNVPERPKVEDYEDQLVIIARMVMPKKKSHGFHSEQVSLVLGKHYLLTVQEEPKRDCFEAVRSRIFKNKGIICKNGPDYLAYALMDAIIDGFFPVLEKYGERIEDLEDEVISQPTPKTLKKIYKVKRELLQLRRAIWPQRNLLHTLIQDENEMISHEVRVYLRDCYDHAVQVIDMLETYRELASGLMDVYLSAVSNRMNEIMKLLTVISAIFIPLTFIAGVYGMNFNTEKSPYNMPELNWYWGYPACLAVMAVIAGILLYIFWRKGWLENSSRLNR